MAPSRLSRNGRLLILSLLLGVVGALGAELFKWMLRLSGRYLLGAGAGFVPPTPDSVARHGPVPVLPPLDWHIPLITTLGGLAAGVLVYAFAPEAEGHGSDAVVRAYHKEGGRIRARVPVVKAVASAITIGSGGSAGREGPTAQIAAGVASVLGSFFRLDEEERHYLLLIGMAAGLSAIFKSWLGTAIFSAEILYGGLSFEGIVLSFNIVAAGVAYGITGAMDGWSPLFHLPSGLVFDNASGLVWYGVLGVSAGLVASIVPRVFYGVRDAFQRLRVPPHLRPAIGGLLLGIPAMWLPQVLGGGYGWMQLAIDSRLPVLLMLGIALAKLLALSLSVGSGGSGGVFAPTLYVGTMLGGALAVAVHHVGAAGVDSQAFAVVGMAAVFGAAARVPLATLVMVIEMTGAYALVVPTMLSVILAVLIQQALTRGSRYPSLYEAQVTSPADSPIHRREYYRTTVALLRKHDIRLDNDVIVHQMADRLDIGEGVPLPGNRQCLYAISVARKSQAVWKEVWQIPLPADAVLVSVMRDHRTIAVHGNTRIETGDRVMVAAGPEALLELRHVFSDPAADSERGEDEGTS